MFEGLDQAIQDPTQTVSLSVKPVVPPVGADAGSNSSSAPQGQATSPSSSNKPKLNRNPQLVSTPSTVQADDIYAAQLAQARFKVDQQYLAALRDIGFTDEKGQFIPGLIQTEAARRQADLQDQYRLAGDSVNNNAVQGGTFFSGRRATNLSNALNPISTNMARTEEDRARSVSDRYNDITNLLSGYSLTQDELLAELAGRQGLRAQQHPSGALTMLHPTVRAAHGHVATGSIGRGNF